MVIVGVDVGVSGAFAVFDNDRVIYLDDLPTLKAQRGGRKKAKVRRGQKAKVQRARKVKERPVLDLPALTAMLEQFQPVHCCYVEAVHAWSGQGVASGCHFCEASGEVRGIAAGLHIPLTLIDPKDWQRHHRVVVAVQGRARRRALQAAYLERARQLYPDAGDRLARVRDHNRAAALLIGSFGAARLGGVEKPRKPPVLRAVGD